MVSKAKKQSQLEQNTQSAPFLNFNEFGMQNVAEMTLPVNSRSGYAARGSRSIASDAPRGRVAPAVCDDKLKRRRTSRLDGSSSIASPGVCAILDLPTSRPGFFVK